MPSDKTCCVPGCSNNRGVSQEVLHGFPNPIKEFERFNAWKIIIGAHLFEGLSDEHMKYRRVCRRHFELKYLCRNNRISSIAVPTINLAGKYQPSNESKPVEVPFISNAKPMDNPTITTTIDVAKPVSDCEVTQAVSATINTDICTNVATEVVISDCEEPNYCHEIITETDKSYDGIDEFLTIPARTNNSLQTTEQKRNNEEIDHVPAVLINITCDNCSKTILGFRYKCLHCVDYNHCHKCEMQEAHPNHYMIRMPKSPEFKLSEQLIDKICGEFKAARSSGEANQRQEFISCDNKPVNNKSEDCDSDVDLPEEVKLLICKEVRDKLVDKTNLAKTDEIIKRKKNFPNDIPKKRKITVKTNSINNEALEIVGIGRNSIADPNLLSMNIANSEDLGRENNERSSTIATIVTDATSPDVVHMMLSDVVSQVIIEMTKDDFTIVWNKYKMRPWCQRDTIRNGSREYIETK